MPVVGSCSDVVDLRRDVPACLFSRYHILPISCYTCHFGTHTCEISESFEAFYISTLWFCFSS